MSQTQPIVDSPTKIQQRRIVKIKRMVPSTGKIEVNVPGPGVTEKFLNGNPKPVQAEEAKVISPEASKKEVELPKPASAKKPEEVVKTDPLPSKKRPFPTQ